MMLYLITNSRLILKTYSLRVILNGKDLSRLQTDLNNILNLLINIYLLVRHLHSSARGDRHTHLYPQCGGRAGERGKPRRDV